MGYKVNKIRVGTQQVRPSEITETYIIPQYSKYDSGTYTSIAKSGKTIKSVTIDGSIDLSNTSYSYIGGYIGICDSSSYSKVFRIFLERNNTNHKGLNFRINRTQYYIYELPSGVVNASGYNKFNLKITRTGYTFTMNGTVYSDSFTTQQQGWMADIMNSSSAVGYTWSTYYSINNQTYIVSYQ